MSTPSKKPKATPSKFFIEVPSLGINVTVRRIQKTSQTIVEFPLYAYDRRSAEPRVEVLPGLDWNADQIHKVVTVMVSEYLRGTEEGRREVRDQVLRGVGLHGLREAVDDLADKVGKIADQVDKPARRKH